MRKTSWNCPATYSWSRGCDSTGSLLRYHNNRTGDTLTRPDNLLSPRVGVVVKPAAPVSIYSSYSVSYLPSSGDQFSSLTTITEQVNPDVLRQREQQHEHFSGILARGQGRRHNDILTLSCGVVSDAGRGPVRDRV